MGSVRATVAVLVEGAEEQLDVAVADGFLRQRPALPHNLRHRGPSVRQARCWRRRPEAHVDDALCGAHVILQLRTALKIVHSLWGQP